MNVTQIKIWKVSGNSSLKGKADISFETGLGEITLKGFRIVEVSGKAPFVAPPQESYPDKAGTRKYKDLVWAGPAFQSSVYPQVLKEYSAVSAGTPS